jgi:hypothetical protein
MGLKVVEVTSTIPAQEARIFCLNKSQYHGHMAPSLGRKYLVCFYCNIKTGIKYDGLITQWECSQCQSVNFLDEVCDVNDGFTP